MQTTCNCGPSAWKVIGEILSLALLGLSFLICKMGTVSVVVVKIT